MRYIILLLMPIMVCSHDYCPDPTFEMEQRIENRKIRILDGMITKAERANFNKDFWYRQAIDATVRLSCGDRDHFIDECITEGGVRYPCRHNHEPCIDGRGFCRD